MILMTELEAFVKNLLETNYDMGNVVAVSKLKAGDTNNSFMAVASKEGEIKNWYIRQYNPAEREEDILYEHAFEKYFAGRVNNEIQTLLPLPTKSGKTWVVDTFNNQSNFYAVYNVISGNEPYSWEFNDLSENAMESCAEITAKFHAWGYGFEAPEGAGRHEPSLEEQFCFWKYDFPKAIKTKKKQPEIFRRYKDYLEQELPFLLDTTDFCSRELSRHSASLKKCINHKDLNPGNVMFDDDDRVNAIFDMDWCNMDYRLYDIAWMSYQSIASWNTHTWGAVPIEKLTRFIDTYNRVMEERNCPLGPLTEEEREFLPTMIIICNMKVIADFACYEEHSHDPYRVFVNTWRFVESVRFMRNYLEERK